MNLEFLTLIIINKMRIKKILIFLLFVTHVFSQLPILYTKDKYGNEREILNGRNAKQYRGGIFILGKHINNNQHFMRNVHKQSDPITSNYWNRHKHNPNPNIPAFNILGTLYTKKKNGEYTPILKKDGLITKRYKGGIYFKDAKGIEHRIHKRAKHGYFQAPKRRRRPKVKAPNIPPRPIAQPIPQIIISQLQPYIQIQPRTQHAIKRINQRRIKRQQTLQNQLQNQNQNQPPQNLNVIQDQLQNLLYGGHNLRSNAKGRRNTKAPY